MLTLWDHEILATALCHGHPSCLGEETEVQGGGKPSAVLRTPGLLPLTKPLPFLPLAEQHTQDEKRGVGRDGPGCLPSDQRTPAGREPHRKAALLHSPRHKCALRRAGD